MLTANLLPGSPTAGAGPAGLAPLPRDLALSVGIFPYVLKLLQSSARELRPILVFIWAKVEISVYDFDDNIG